MAAPEHTNAHSAHIGRASAIACYGIECLPARCDDLFASGQYFCLGRTWFRNMTASGLPAGTQASFAVLRQGGEAMAMLPLQRGAKGELQSLTNCYTCLYRPLIATEEHAGEIARGLGHAVGRLFARRPQVRIECLPPDWPALDGFIDGLRAAGLSVRRFAHFGNWHEPVRGRGWDEYLAERPGNLRELLRRRGRRRERAGLRLEVIERPEELPRGIAAYETIYRKSWKPHEPFPDFNPSLMREAAGERALRLGIYWRDGTPIAAQLWIVAHGSATVMKLAHDEAQRALSPGTLLTAEMIARLLREGVTEIDFGRGDDPYKRLWAGTRRQRIGLLILNPRRPSGLLALSRHDLGRAVRATRRRFAVSRA